MSFQSQLVIDLMGIFWSCAIRHEAGNEQHDYTPMGYRLDSGTYRNYYTKEEYEYSEANNGWTYYWKQRYTPGTVNYNAVMAIFAEIESVFEKGRILTAMDAITIARKVFNDANCITTDVDDNTREFSFVYMTTRHPLRFNQGWWGVE